MEQVEIDFVMLADYAEVVNGKLYMMGGAWDRRSVSDFAHPVPLTIAIGVLVPWHLTNEPHNLQVTLEHEDGTAIKPVIQATVTVGRPTDAVKGQQFRAMATIRGSWTLPGAGVYRVTASVPDMGASKQAVFRAVQSGK